MNRDPYAVALDTALNEIKKAYPDVKHSFLFATNGAIITGDPETDKEIMKEVIESFEIMKDNAKVIGNFKSFQVNGKNGKLILSSIRNMYLVLATSKKADKTHIYSIIHVIIPTILKTLEPITPIPLELTPPKNLVVDTLSGFFAGDSVQVDAEILMEWNKKSDARAHFKAAITGEEETQKSIDQVNIVTVDGNNVWCKVKEIKDEKLKGKNMVRIPEKICKTLEIQKGDLVKVKPEL